MRDSLSVVYIGDLEVLVQVVYLGVPMFEGGLFCFGSRLACLYIGDVTRFDTVLLHQLLIREVFELVLSGRGVFGPFFEHCHPAWFGDRHLALGKALVVVGV